MHILVSGDTYVGKSKGVFVPIKNRNDAVMFKSEAAANNTRVSGLPKILRTNYNWSIVEVVENNTDVESDAKPATYTHIDVAKLMGSINELSGVFSTLQGNKDWLLEQESNLDKQISDILHWIEFNDFSACDGYKLCKALKDLRLQRRNVKNELEVIRIIGVHTCSNLANGKTGNAINGLNTRKYEPRVLSELFEKKKVDVVYKK